MKVNIIGDHVEDENALIVSNHQSIVDHIVFPYLTRRAVNDAELERLNIFSDSDEETSDKKAPPKEEKKEVKKGSKIKFKILNNEEPFFAKDLSTLLIPKNKFFTWFEIWGIPTIDYFTHISQADENWEMTERL